MYTMEYYSDIRKDEMLPFLTTWMDPENTMLREINRMEKVKNHMISLMWDIKLKTGKQSKPTETRPQTTAWWLSKGKGVRGW